MEKNVPKISRYCMLTLVGLPLFNRALTAMYPPGSTFKLIDALIAQNDGVINRSTVYPCQGGYPPMHGKPKCHRHAACDLIGSVAQSCNSYYSYVFRDIVDQKKYPKFIDGYNHWRDMVRTFGPARDRREICAEILHHKPGWKCCSSVSLRGMGADRAEAGGAIDLQPDQEKVLDIARIITGRS